MNHTTAFHLGVVSTLLEHEGVHEAVMKAKAAGISFIQILMTLLPFVLQMVSGGKVDWQAIITAILALIQTK